MYADAQWPYTMLQLKIHCCIKVMLQCIWYLWLTWIAHIRHTAWPKSLWHHFPFWCSLIFYHLSCRDIFWMVVIIGLKMDFHSSIYLNCGTIPNGFTYQCDAINGTHKVSHKTLTIHRNIDWSFFSSTCQNSNSFEFFRATRCGTRAFWCSKNSISLHYMSINFNVNSFK